MWELLAYWSAEHPPTHVTLAGLVRGLSGDASTGAAAPLQSEDDVRAAFGQFL